VGKNKILLAEENRGDQNLMALSYGVCPIFRGNKEGGSIGQKNGGDSFKMITL